MNENRDETKKFTSCVYEEYKQLKPGGNVFVNIGEKRGIRRSITNEYMEIIVLNEKEKQFIEDIVKTNRYETKSFTSYDSVNSYKDRVKTNNRINQSNTINRTKEESEKKVQNTKQKKEIKGVSNKKNKKRFTLSDKFKRLGAGLMALAMMGVIASETLTNRAENIERYNKEFTSVEQVEDKIKELIDAEITEAIDCCGIETENLTITIERIEPYRDYQNEGVKIIIDGVNVNYDNKMVLREEKFNGGNVPETLEKMAEYYLDVQEMSDSEMTNSKKNKAIKALERVEYIADKTDFRIKESKGIFDYKSDYKMKTILEENGDEYQSR